MTARCDLGGHVTARQWPHTHTHTHTTILRPCWILSRTTTVSQHQKGKTRKVKPIWIYWSKIVSSSGISWAICKSAPCLKTHNHVSIPPLSFSGWMPFLPLKQQRQSTEGSYVATTAKSKATYWWPHPAWCSAASNHAQWPDCSCLLFTAVARSINLLRSDELW